MFKKLLCALITATMIIPTFQIEAKPLIVNEAETITEADSIDKDSDNSILPIDENEYYI